MTDAGHSAALDLRIHDSFDEIRPLWRAFERDAVMSVYQGLRWLELWHSHVGGATLDRLALVVGERDGRPVFIWPLGIWRAGPLKIARWLGGKFNNYNLGLWCPSEIAAITEEEMRRALGDIARKAGIDSFELANQPKTWEGFDNPFAMICEQQSPSNSFVMDLEPDFDALYARRRSSRSRRTQRRKRETMAEAGEIRLLHARDEATVLKIVDALVEQRNARAAEAGIPSIFAEKGAQAMTREILLDGLSSPTTGPIMEAHALEVGGIIRATYVGGVHRGRYSCFLNSFREDDLTATSPGDQLLLDVVEYCCQSGMTQLDLGIGEARYKSAWCEPDPLFDSFIAMSAAGRLHAGFYELRQSVKRAIKANPVLWNAVKKARQLRSRAHF
ncbi:GNAT family N-acetyltransferase [Breoghania corrubedonensis]|nr:GNAT family N-acetyltransferase [Breoghania corrubedonensis]